MSRLSGQDALAAIDGTLQRARKTLDVVEQRHSQARAELAGLQHQEIAVYAELARMRLLDIESGALIDALSHADRQVAQLLEQRAQAQVLLQEKIEQANTALGETERSRSQQRDTVSEAADALDAAEAAAQAALQDDAAWQAQSERVSHAQFVAEQAQEKAESARRDRIEKGRPYEDDPLFSYLHERGYGTSAYSAWPLTRWLDGRVAALCDYEPARRDYALLTEIPVRLAEHAGAMEETFEAQFEALRLIEEQAAEAAGVPRCAQTLEAEQQRLDEIDAQIAQREDALRELVRERVQFGNGTDSWYQRCIELLTAAMRRDGTLLLRERAARTPEPDDDLLVGRLAEFDDEIARLEQDLADHRRAFDSEAARLHDFEEIRQRFKGARFDDPRSQFLDGALFTLVLERLLNGAVSAGDAWKAIRRQQRMSKKLANPRFGTNRFPRGPKRGPWRWPPGGSSGRSGGGFGGGGFRGGGGFGGGGFRSGGGF